MGANDKILLRHATRTVVTEVGPEDTGYLQMTLPNASSTLAGNPVASGLTTQGDLIQGDAAGEPVRLPRGTNMQVLGMNTAGTDVAWQASCCGTVSAAIDLSAQANSTIALPYSAAASFIPTHVVVTCTVNMTGDAKLIFGTTAGGAEIQAETTMTGLTTAGQRWIIPITAKVVGAIAGNATLHIRVSTVDTTGTGRVTVRYIGQTI